MNPSAQGVNLEDVERAIRAGFRLPRFDPLLERQFEADTGESRCRVIIRQNYIGLLIYHCFLYSDYKTVGDAFDLDLWMHFGVMTPFVVVLNLVLHRHPPAWLREGLQSLATIVLALTIVTVVSASRMPDRDSLLMTLNLVVSFAIFMQRIQFLYCVLCCMFINAFHMVGLTSFPDFSADRVMMLNFFLISLIIFSLVGSYNLDREHRTAYLLALRDRLRNRHLEIASLRDALTGIGNRRALDAALERLAAPAAASPSRLSSICLLDIDHFKAFNDTNGHQAGDACLRRVADLIAASLRDEGTVYRFGGEEFLILLEGTSAGAASAAAERVRSSVAQARIPRDPAAAAFVTVSVGVACGCLKGDVTADALIAAADGALYRAKHDGRDRVRSASPLVATEGEGRTAANDGSALEEGIRQPLVA